MGHFKFKTPRIVEKIRAVHFGHHTSRWHIPVPILPVRIELKKAGASELPPSCAAVPGRGVVSGGGVLTLLGCLRGGGAAR
jgi:hypothetical protein